MDLIKMVDLHKQYVKIKPQIDNSILSVVGNTNYINGAEVGEFSLKLAAYLDVKHVIACANGTDALQIALMALDLLIGSEIIMPSFSYIAAAEAVVLLGYVPVFIDSQSDTFNMDSDHIEKNITAKTKAIMAVHLFGQGCDMLPILKIAQKHNLYIIEDNAQSIGSNYYFPDGVPKKLGSIGHVGTTSFFPSKNLGAMGDGGAIFTNDDALAEKLKIIANHGQKTRYLHQKVGVNSRLDTIQAAVLLIKLSYFEEYLAARKLAASLYDVALQFVPEIEIPKRLTTTTHTFHQYTLKVKNGKRNELKEYLDQKAIPCMIYYPLPIHEQEPYSKFAINVENLPVAKQLSHEVLSLPMHTELNMDQIDYICESIKQFFS